MKHNYLIQSQWHIAVAGLRVDNSHKTLTELLEYVTSRLHGREMSECLKIWIFSP